MMTITADTHTETGTTTYYLRQPSGAIISTHATLVAAEASKASIERNQAKLAAKFSGYEAAGYRIVKDFSGFTRAQRMRGAHRIAVATADDTIVATYATLKDLPAIEDTDLAPAAEAETVEEAAEVEAAEAPVRGTITDSQAREILTLIDYGAHTEGGFMSGPTDEAGVLALSREDAALYLDSLNGTY